MRRHLRWVAAIAVAVVLTLIVRWPLAWSGPLLPAAIACSGPGGTLWSGRCASLRVGALDIGTAAWRWRPTRLLAGRLAFDIEATRALDRVNGRVEWGAGQRLDARDIDAQLSPGGGLLPAIPGALQGRVTARLARLSVRERVVTAIEGQVEVRELRQGVAATPLGNFFVTFPANAGSDGPVVGALRDAGGPLAVSGTLTLTAEPGYVVEGLVAARADASPQLARQLEVLGRADAEGRRPFSVAGTY